MYNNYIRTNKNFMPLSLQPQSLAQNLATFRDEMMVMYPEHRATLSRLTGGIHQLLSDFFKSSPERDFFVLQQGVCDLIETRFEADLKALPKEARASVTTFRSMMRSGLLNGGLQWGEPGELPASQQDEAAPEEPAIPKAVNVTVTPFTNSRAIIKGEVPGFQEKHQTLWLKRAGRGNKWMKVKVLLGLFEEEVGEIGVYNLCVTDKRDKRQGEKVGVAVIAPADQPESANADASVVGPVAGIKIRIWPMILRKTAELAVAGWRATLGGLFKNVETRHGASDVEHGAFTGKPAAVEAQHLAPPESAPEKIPTVVIGEGSNTVIRGEGHAVIMGTILGFDPACDGLQYRRIEGKSGWQSVISNDRIDAWGNFVLRFNKPGTFQFQVVRNCASKTGHGGHVFLQRGEITEVVVTQEPAEESKRVQPNTAAPEELTVDGGLQENKTQLIPPQVAAPPEGRSPVRGADIGVTAATRARKAVIKRPVRAPQPRSVQLDYAVLRPKNGGAAGVEIEHGRGDRTMSLRALEGFDIEAPAGVRASPSPARPVPLASSGEDPFSTPGPKPGERRTPLTSALKQRAFILSHIPEGESAKVLNRQLWIKTPEGGKKRNVTISLLKNSDGGAVVTAEDVVGNRVRYALYASGEIMVNSYGERDATELPSLVAILEAVGA